MGFKAWETPRADRNYDPKFGDFEHWHCQFGFTLDAAANHANHLLPKYCTPRGMFFDQFSNANFKSTALSARERKLNDFDGLDPRAWRDEVVFCNPPYDDTLYDWVALAASRVAKTSVLLLPPSIDTAWFHDFLWNGDGKTSWSNPFHTEVRFKRGRTRFNKRGVPGDAPRAGNMLAVFRRQAW